MTQVSGKIHIDAPKSKVWGVLADLGTVSAWNPVISKSYYTSEDKEGVGAARHCDFPDGGFVKERASDWKPGEAYKLDIYEGTVPFDNFYGLVEVKDDGQGTAVTFTLNFDVRPNAPIDTAEAERQNRDELIPTVLAGLKHYLDTGQKMPMPAPSP